MSAKRVFDLILRPQKADKQTSSSPHPTSTSHCPNPQSFVGETSEKSLPVRRPCDRYTFWLPSLVGDLVSRLELINDRPIQERARMNTGVNWEVGQETLTCSPSQRS